MPMPSEPPDVRYARSGDVHIAYVTVGAGPVDVVFVRGFAGDLLSVWEQPLLMRFIDELSTFARTTMLDKRGTGLSDRVREVRRSRRAWTTSGPCSTRSAPRARSSGRRKRGPVWRPVRGDVSRAHAR